MEARSYCWLRSLYHPEEVLKRCLEQLMKTDRIFLLMRYVVCWVENQSVGVFLRPSCECECLVERDQRCDCETIGDGELRGSGRRRGSSEGCEGEHSTTTELQCGEQSGNNDRE